MLSDSVIALTTTACDLLRPSIPFRGTAFKGNTSESQSDVMKAESCTSLEPCRSERIKSSRPDSARERDSFPMIEILLMFRPFELVEMVVLLPFDPMVRPSPFRPS